MSVTDILTVYGGQIGAGLMVTLRLCLIAWLGGIGAGIGLGALAARQKTTFGRAVQGAAFVVSSIPVLVLLLWLHYPLQSMLGVIIDPFYTAAATLLLVNALAVAEAVRGAMADFPRQYVTAGKVCGLSGRQIFRHIELPILTRQLIPPILTIQVGVLHATLFASLISVGEIFRVSQRINAMVYAPIPIYTSLGMFFLAICLPLTLLAAWYKRRFTRNLSLR